MLQRRAGNLRRPISIKITLNPSSPSHNFPPNHYWLDPSNQIALLLSEVRDWPPMLIIQFANWSASLRVVSHLHRLLRFKDCLDSGRLMAEIARGAWITIIALGKDDISRTFSNSSRSKAFQSCWLVSSPVLKKQTNTTLPYSQLYFTWVTLTCTALSIFCSSLSKDETIRGWRPPAGRLSYTHGITAPLSDFHLLQMLLPGSILSSWFIDTSPLHDIPLYRP